MDPLSLSLSILIFCFFISIGNQGNSWSEASATVPVSTGTYQIVFEGIVGNGYQGDIAIDDYSIVTGSCSSIGDCFSYYPIQ